MAKNMRDFDKIREEYDFQLDNRQIKLLITGGFVILVLTFVCGFLIGRHFPPQHSTFEMASRPMAEEKESDQSAHGEERSQSFKYEFFEELSQTETAEQANPKEPAVQKVEDPAPESPKSEQPDIRAVDEMIEKGEEAEAEGRVELPEILLPAGPSDMEMVPSQYTVQVAAFADAESAEKLSSRLLQKGYASYTRIKSIPGKGTWHRVRVGQYSSKDDAERDATLLEEREGLSTFITLYARN